MNSVCYVGGIYAVRKTHSPILTLSLSLALAFFLLLSLFGGLLHGVFPIDGLCAAENFGLLQIAGDLVDGVLGRNGAGIYDRGGVARIRIRLIFLHCPDPQKYLKP